MALAIPDRARLTIGVLLGRRHLNRHDSQSKRQQFRKPSRCHHPFALNSANSDRDEPGLPSRLPRVGGLFRGPFQPHVDARVGAITQPSLIETLLEV